MLFHWGYGAYANGTRPNLPNVQFLNALEKIGVVMGETGLSYAVIVNTTTYHIGLAEHFELSKSISPNCVKEIYLASTAVEVTGLRRQEPLLNFG